MGGGTACHSTILVIQVADGRKLPVEEVRKVARGRVWTGQQALQLGLVDALGGLEDAIALAKEKAGLPQVTPGSCSRPVM